MFNNLLTTKVNHVKERLFGDGMSLTHSVDSLGRCQDLSSINESNLYKGYLTPIRF